MNIEEILAVVREATFSRRIQFWKSLQESTRHIVAGTGENVVVQWPDVLLIATERNWNESFREIFGDKHP